MNTNLVKRLLFFIILVLTAVVLISCEKQTDKPEEPIIEEPIEQEPEEQEPEVDYDFEEFIVLIDELRVKDKSHTVIFKNVSDYSKLRVELFMGGSYDNPVTIKNIKVNGNYLDLKVDGLATKAGEHSSGKFNLDGYNVEFHRATNYQPLRIKSDSNENGYMILDLEGIVELEIELVFTTGAVNYFEKVEIELVK